MPSPAPTQSVVEGCIFGLVFLYRDGSQCDITACGHQLPSLCLKVVIYRVTNTLLKKGIGGADVSPRIGVILIEVDGMVIVGLHLLCQRWDGEENND
jgi:hypothetical protein